MSDGDVTQLLVAFREGDKVAFEQLVPLVYDDMRKIARGHLRRHRRGETMNTEVLVHEAYLRLVDQTRAEYADRSHFYAVCACAMRQIIVSYARRKNAEKRGGKERDATLDEEHHVDTDQATFLLDLDRALERLEARHPRMARVVECRYFAGLSEEETAKALDTSLRTVQREWTRARAWLRRDLGGSSI